jgi:hypothetical protein
MQSVVEQEFPCRKGFHYPKPCIMIRIVVGIVVRIGIGIGGCRRCSPRSSRNFHVVRDFTIATAKAQTLSQSSSCGRIICYSGSSWGGAII